jgi:DMSO/TMAO reductase YedYZ molybdopterin-dependent catalytic subunit
MAEVSGESNPDATIEPKAGAGPSAGMGSKKLAAMVIAVAFLIAVPLGYLVIEGMDSGDGEALVTVEGMAETEDISLDDLSDMTYVEGISEYQNRFNNWRGLGTYGGVPLDELADLVGGMGPGDLMTVIASDGYAQNLSYYQVYAEGDALEIQGRAILAYKYNGTQVPDWTDGPCIAVLPEDEAFSNDDFNATASSDPEFNSSTSAGSIWVKNVERIRIAERVAFSVTVLGDSVDLKISDLREMETCDGSGYFKKSTGAILGPFNYTGVPVSDLVDLVYEGDNYSLRVVAWDGYEMTYSAVQVENGTFAVYDLEGTVIGPMDITMMLAFEEDGEEMEYDSLRIVLVDEEAPVTDGHFWAKQVRSIEVLPYIQDWTLYLSGVYDMDLDRQTFESLASCAFHTVEYEFTNDSGEHVYEGVPLWVLVSAVDGGDAPDGHYLFNDALAEAGYTVNVTAMSDEPFTANFDAAQVARNDSIIVVYKLDGEVLPEDSFPLRIVGDDLPGMMKVKKITHITIEGFVELPAWEIALQGLTEAVFTQWDFTGLFNCDDGLHVAYYNYTEDDVEHSYAGIPLWVLIGLVDGETEADHWTFNETLAALAYTVTVTATDLYDVELPVEWVMYNDSLILALTFDGEYLTDSYYPVTLVGEELPSSMKVKGVASIVLTDLPE